MPLDTYQCLDCAAGDDRVAGLDDHTALCVRCGGLMLRRDADVFKSYFDEAGPGLRPQAAAAGAPC